MKNGKIKIIFIDNCDMTSYIYTVAHFVKVDIDRSYIQCMRPDHEVGGMVYMSRYKVAFHMLRLVIQTCLTTYYYLID